MALKKNKTPLAADKPDPSPVPNPAEQETKTQPDQATERLNLAVELVKKKFNLSEGYRVVKFSDKGKVVDLTLDGPDFIVSVTIKNSEMHGMYIPPTPAE